MLRQLRSPLTMPLATIADGFVGLNDGSSRLPPMDDTKASPSRHRALADELKSDVASGRYPIGSRFPSEQDLQERFGVGRHTVREALKVLTEQGLLGRRRKTGTVVLSLEPVGQYIHTLRDIKGLFDFAHSTVLDIRQQGFGSSGASSPFDGFPDPHWFRVAGLRLGRPTLAPLCWSEILVPKRYAPDREAVGRGDKAVYEIVMDQHGLQLDHVEQEISAQPMPASFAGLLQAEAGGAALMVKRRYVDRTGTAFEISHNLYPADRYSVRSVIRQRA